MMTMQRTLEEVIRPALDAYGEALAEHGQSFLTYPERACICGWRPKRQGTHAGQAVGLHISAANKRAKKACDVDMRRLRDEARAEGWRS